MDEAQSPDFKERLAQSWADDMEEVAQKAADTEGQPMGARKVGDARAVRLYGLKDQKVTPEMMVPALLNGALPQELTDPNSPHAMLIIKENPDLAKYYAQPAKTADAAETLASWAEYPFRYGLIMGIDDPNERYRYSEHIHALWQQSQPQAESEPMSEPSPMAAPAPAPDPSMPVQPPPGPAPMPDPRMMMGG